MSNPWWEAAQQGVENLRDAIEPFANWGVVNDGEQPKKGYVPPVQPPKARTPNPNDNGIQWVPKFNPMTREGMRFRGDGPGKTYIYEDSNGRRMKVDQGGNIIWMRWSV